MKSIINHTKKFEFHSPAPNSIFKVLPCLEHWIFQRLFLDTPVFKDVNRWCTKTPIQILVEGGKVVVWSRLCGTQF